jgi:hypothetical protein
MITPTLLRARSLDEPGVGIPHAGSWFLIYFIAGFLLAKRPDIVGLVVTDASTKGNLPNKSPLPIPANVKLAADAPVAPPPGAQGGSR